MKISRLKNRITIQKSSVEVDEIGNRLEQWQDYYNCYANLDTRKQLGNEINVAEIIVDHLDITFKIRYSKILENLNSKEYRIQFKDELYNIKSVDFMNYNYKEIKILAKKVSR